jgi:hypothetical protein
VGSDNPLFFASDAPWAITTASSHVSRRRPGEGELGRMVLRDNFTTLDD